MTKPQFLRQMSQSAAGHFTKLCRRDSGQGRGMAVGEAQGKEKGEAQALERLLEKRIGAVSDTLRARIFAADLAAIEAWFDRAIDATELESVFERN